MGPCNRHHSESDRAQLKRFFACQAAMPRVGGRRQNGAREVSLELAFELRDVLEEV